MKTAIEAYAAGDLETVAHELLGAWRQCHAPAVADLLDEVDAQHLAKNGGWEHKGAKLLERYEQPIDVLDVAAAGSALVRLPSKELGGVLRRVVRLDDPRWVTALGPLLWCGLFPAAAGTRALCASLDGTPDPRIRQWVDPGPYLSAAQYDALFELEGSTQRLRSSEAPAGFAELQAAVQVGADARRSALREQVELAVTMDVGALSVDADRRMEAGDTYGEFLSLQLTDERAPLKGSRRTRMLALANRWEPVVAPGLHRLVRVTGYRFGMPWSVKASVEPRDAPVIGRFPTARCLGDVLLTPVMGSRDHGLTHLTSVPSDKGRHLVDPARKRQTVETSVETERWRLSQPRQVDVPPDTVIVDVVPDELVGRDEYPWKPWIRREGTDAVLAVDVYAQQSAAGRRPVWQVVAMALRTSLAHPERPITVRDGTSVLGAFGHHVELLGGRSVRDHDALIAALRASGIKRRGLPKSTVEPSKLVCLHPAGDHEVEEDEHGVTWSIDGLRHARFRPDGTVELALWIDGFPGHAPKGVERLERVGSWRRWSALDPGWVHVSASHTRWILERCRRVLGASVTTELARASSGRAELSDGVIRTVLEHAAELQAAYASHVMQGPAEVPALALWTAGDQRVRALVEPTDALVGALRRYRVRTRKSARTTVYVEGEHEDV